ncbi:MAG: hypothetical protein WCA46_29910, partial [Actinocatenispora sp.]
MVTGELSPATASGSAVRLIGGEMLSGSDTGPEDTARFGAWLLALLGDAVPRAGRVLLAGTHGTELVEALTARGLVADLVLRSLPDARATRVQLAATGVRVLCGGLDRLPSDDTVGGYDAVLALDGVDRLCGPDSPPHGWTDMVALLAGLARPGGLLAVLVDNGLGMRRLTVAEPDPATSAAPGRVTPPTG